MDILLTGASGFLGSIIYYELEKKHKVYTLGRSEKLSAIKCDLSIQIPDLSTYQFDTIIHSAGKAHIVPKTEPEKQAFYDVNLKGTKNLLSGIEKLKVKPTSFIFISSVAVYGLNEGEYISESAPLEATDPYGHSKILSENFITEWGKKNNISIIILRLPLLSGKNPQGNLQAMIKGIKKGYYFNIKDNFAKKSIVLADDVAKLLANNELKEGIYNLTDDYHPNFLEISNAIAFHLQKKKPIELPYWLIKTFALLGNIIGRNAPINTSKLKKMSSTLTFSNKKAKEQLNWHPRNVIDHLKIE